MNKKRKDLNYLCCWRLTLETQERVTAPGLEIIKAYHVICTTRRCCFGISLLHSMEKRLSRFCRHLDGWQDLKLHKEMTWEFERAENGNVALTGEFDMQETNGNSFVVALGFGRNTEEAGQRARASILEVLNPLKHNL